MKVKFSRTKLIAALKKSKEQALSIFRKDTKAYHENLKKAHSRYIANVEKFLTEARNSKPENVITDNYGVHKRVMRDIDWPSKPREPRIEYTEALIQQLELGVDETIICDTKEEYVQLTRACAILGTCKL